MPTTQPFDTTATGTGLTIPTITPERGGNDSGADDKADNEDGKIPATTSSNHSGGLTAGAKAGVGVGAAAAVIIILALILIWLRKRKRSRARAGGYLEPTRSERELKEKEGVGIVAHSTHGSTSQIAGSEAAGMGAGAGVARSGSYHLGDDRSGLGGGAAAPAVGKKPIAGAAGAEDLENGRESRASVPTQTLSEEERARWEEEERRLDADIAEAERRRRV